MKPETKYKGAIKLSAIGDALGWITEFEKNSASLEKKYGTDVVDRFYNWSKNVGGKFYGYLDNISAGSYSDDTQLMLAVARSIRLNGYLDNQYFAKRELKNWIYYARGGGRTVKFAAEKINRKSVNWFNNFYNYKVEGKLIDYRETGANGAAMRVLPIALANLGDFEKIKAETFKNSIITHGHPRAIIGAILFNYAINTILVYRPEDFTWENFLTSIGTDILNKLDYKSFTSSEISLWEKEWNKGSQETFEQLYEVTITETHQHLRLCYQLLKADTNDQDALSKFGCYNLETKGSGISTVIAGIFLACKYHYKPVDAIRAAVNSIGADTDSIAAFTGALIGSLHGQSIIPDKWKNVQDMNYLEKVASDLLNISEERELDRNFTLFRNSFVDKEWDLVVNQQINFDPLGKGIVTNIERQDTLTAGKYNLIVDVYFEIGQSCRFTKVLSKENPVTNSIEPDLNWFKRYLTKEDYEVLVQKVHFGSFKKKEVIELLKWYESASTKAPQ